MKNSKKKRLIQNTTYCFLSGEPIIRIKDLTKEHYCPKSKVAPYIANDPYNIKPAIKIVNSIKGDLFPCEWEEVKLERVYHAIRNYNLDSYERALLNLVFEKYKIEGQKDVCPLCVLYKLNLCNSR